MLCPNCKTDAAISIHCKALVAVYVTQQGDVDDSSPMDDGYEWDDSTSASCADCDFSGTVKDLKDADPTEE